METCKWLEEEGDDCTKDIPEDIACDEDCPGYEEIELTPLEILINAIVAADLFPHSIELIQAIVDGVFNCEHCQSLGEQHFKRYGIQNDYYFCDDEPIDCPNTHFCSYYQQKEGVKVVSEDE